MQPKQRLPACSQNSAHGHVAKLLLQGICRVSIHASDKGLRKHATSTDNGAGVLLAPLHRLRSMEARRADVAHGRTNSPAWKPCACCDASWLR